MARFGNFITWLNTNAQIVSIVLTLLVALVPAAWTFIRYLTLKSKELQHERFKIYHGLIRDLVQPEATGVPMSIDRQIAIVFELRHFTEYFELTGRILEGLRQTWIDPRFARLAQELDRTLLFIGTHSKAKRSTRQLGAGGA
jgi:hypothetical protein